MRGLDEGNDTQVWALVLKAISLLQILIGAVAAYYGPLEIYVFYLFSRNGPFHYDGFGVGSLWFGALVVHNIAYYVLAILLIPVGVGTLKLRRWAHTLSRLYLWGWLAGGVLLVVNLVVLAPAFAQRGQTDAVRWIILGVFSCIATVILPALLLRFYTSRPARRTFDRSDPQLYWTKAYPFPVLALLCLCLCSIVVLHLAIFFQLLLGERGVTPHHRAV